ncbi:MAG: histone H1 [Ignavibacteriales bacterium]|jgi:hypothetical protein|nr:histone H1 [Ignavibacteriales bacterium]NWF91260.1 histone H1 [Ignavibacteriaceae bacterium]
MHQKYQELIDFIQSLEPDIEKFYTKGQSAAGTRLRKGLSELKKKAQELRNDIQAVKASRKGGKSEN